MNKIFTIKYDYTQSYENELDISFNNEPKLREFIAFKIFTKKYIFNEYEFSGIVSPKFTKKIGLTLGEVHEHIDDSYDVILFHPYSLEFSIQNDFLHLAEIEHPGIKKCLKLLWKELYDEELPNLIPEKDSLYFIHCNYIVANKKFWNDYKDIVEQIDKLVKSGKLSELFLSTEYNLRTYNKNEDFIYFPFVFERFLTFYLYKNRKKLRIKNISLLSEYKAPLLFKYEDKIVYFFKKMICSNCKYKKRIKILFTFLYFMIRKIFFKLNLKEENE